MFRHEIAVIIAQKLHEPYGYGKPSCSATHSGDFFKANIIYGL